MNESAIVEFLCEFGVSQNQIKIVRGWVNCPCIFAEWDHDGGIDTNPSFGISINDEEQSVYVCFGCTRTARLMGDILHRYWILSGEYPFDAAALYMRNENFSVESREDSINIDPWLTFLQKETSPPEPLGRAVIPQFPKIQSSGNPVALQALAYLEKDRLVAHRVVNECGIRFDPEREALVFPLTDAHGDIYLLRERALGQKRIWTVSPKIAGLSEDMEFPKLTQIGVWFGYHLINWRRAVMLVEGEIDALRLRTLGFHNVVASCTSSVTDKQIDAIHATTVILGYDADKGGRFATRRVRDRMAGKTELLQVDWSLVSKESGNPCKDAGDLRSREDLEIVLKNMTSLF